MLPVSRSRTERSRSRRSTMAGTSSSGGWAPRPSLISSAAWRRQAGSSVRSRTRPPRPMSRSASATAWPSALEAGTCSTVRPEAAASATTAGRVAATSDPGGASSRMEASELTASTASSWPTSRSPAPRSRSGARSSGSGAGRGTSRAARASGSPASAATRAEARARSMVASKSSISAWPGWTKAPTTRFSRTRKPDRYSRPRLPMRFRAVRGVNPSAPRAAWATASMSAREPAWRRARVRTGLTSIEGSRARVASALEEDRRTGRRRTGALTVRVRLRGSGPSPGTWGTGTVTSSAWEAADLRESGPAPALAPLRGAGWPPRASGAGSMATGPASSASCDSESGEAGTTSTQEATPMAR